ncbi:MAG: cell division ATP-binding protein FtsE [Clostridia bacterium]|nr:cell division ATP-binding protein FtsE [Clostridia bacterium]
MIEFSNVTKIYKETGTKALKGVSFKIPKGDFVFLIGETGAGKTTISRLMQREEKYDRGRIIIDEYNLSDIKKRDIPYLRRKMGVVFQDYRLLAHKNVFENVAFAMEVIGTPKRNIEHMVPQILSLVGLEEKSEARPSQLSGGEQQRVAMARAMANNPPILIADEPTGNLDPDTSREIMYLFERFNRLGTTVIIATHAREIVDEMQKRVIELKDGIVIRDERRGGYYNV